MASERLWSKQQRDIFEWFGTGTGNLVVRARAGTGKCLGVGTPVMLSNGDVIPVEMVCEGDGLMGPDSRPRRVLSTTVGRGPLYRIVPTKGDPWICNEDHILVLSGSNHHAGEEIEVSLRDFIDLDYSDKDWKVVRTGVEFFQPVQEDFDRPVAPYLVGLWLGDGTTGEAQITSDDLEVIEYCRSVANAYGAELAERRDAGAWCLRFRVGGRGEANPSTPNILRRFFRRCVDHTGKRIRKAYLHAEREARLELLAGLVDSDGHYDDRCCMFEISVRPDGLAEDILFLARSLGFAAYDNPGEKVSQTGLGGLYHRITISGDLAVVPTKIARKKARQRRQVKRVNVTGFEIEPVGDGDYYGFTLDGDGRFLLGDFTITHNTTTILEAINYAPETSIIFCAFNKKIADHIRGKLTNPRADAKTLHAIGKGFISERWGCGVGLAERSERADDLTRQALEASGVVDVPFQIRNLISKLNTKARELTPHATRPEQLDYLVDQFECEPDEEFEDLGFDTAFVVRHALAAMELGTQKPKPHMDTQYGGGIDFADMIFLPLRNRWLRPRYDLVIVDEAQDMAAAQLEIAQGICKGRMCLVGDDRQCQPAGTMVRISDRGDVPIEGLKVGDTVETFDRHGQVFIKSGRVTATASRPFSGFLVKIGADDKITRCTPNHKWLVRWTNKSTHTWITYLMRQGNRWRVGQTQLFRHATKMFGLSERARVERADEAWVLKTHESLADALAYEAIVGVIYGLPQMVFHPPSNIKYFTQAVIDTVYESFDEEQQRGKAEQCLVNHGRDIQFPIFKKAEPYTRRGRTTLFETQACNLLGGYMSVAVAPDIITGHNKKDRHAVRWSPVAVHRELFQGLVYSLNIAKHHKYVADGLVTCNSIYGFRGADSNAIDRIKTTLQAGELGLNTTYRCGHAIVKHAARLVPDFLAHHENHPGVIRTATNYVGLVAEAQPGDFVLSRKNAPLAEIAMALIRANKRVKIAGRDIGKGLESTAKKIATGAAERSVPMFLQKLQTWQDKECRRAMKAAKNEAAGQAKCDAIRDKVETLTFLTDGILSVRELLVRIADLFPKREDGMDIDPSTVVMCSSIHKAKGLEADRVFVLVDTLYPKMPAGMKMSASRLREEENLEYVAVTRAVRELVLVGATAGTFVQPALTPEQIAVPLVVFKPTCEQDIDDKAEFDALSAAVAEVEGRK